VTRAARILDDSDLSDLFTRTKRVAVLGIKTEAQRGQPAYDVPHYLDSAGLEVIPVPVYYPDVTAILGKPVYRRLVDIPGPVDLVDVFRRPVDLDAHLEDIIAKHPTAVWLQAGIRSDAFAERAVTAGIDVVQDRCLMVEHRRWALGAGSRR
jgi:predicted CoA-binding protein